jgi:hypothetical protein
MAARFLQSPLCRTHGVPSARRSPGMPRESVEAAPTLI